MVVNEEFLEKLLSNTLMIGKRNQFVNQLKNINIDAKSLMNLEVFADSNIGNLIAKVKQSPNDKKALDELEDYLKVISKDKTFSEVFNMSMLEGDAVVNTDQTNKFVVPMNDMAQRVSDIVSNAIKQELQSIQIAGTSQFSNDNNDACPECGKSPCECEGGTCDQPKDGSECPAGVGVDKSKIVNQEPSTKIDKRVDDLEQAFSHVADILSKMNNFDDQPAQTNPENGEQPVNDEKSKAYYDGLNTAKKLEEIPEDKEKYAEELADKYGFKEGSDKSDFIEGFMVGLEPSKGGSDLHYSDEYDMFYSDDGDEFYYSDEYGVYSDENGNILCHSKTDDIYYTKTAEDYFSDIDENNFSEVNTNMDDVKIYFSEEDNCFFSEFGEALKWDENHKAYLGENGSVYFSETGPYTSKNETQSFSKSNVTNFSSNENIALFSENGTAIINYSEVDADGDLVCYSEDGRVFVRDGYNGCYFSGDGDIYFDSEDLENAEDDKDNEVEKAATPAQVGGDETIPLPSADAMAQEDNALVNDKSGLKQEVDGAMAQKVANNEDGIPSPFVPSAPAPEAKGENFSCYTFSEVKSQEDANARYNNLKNYLFNN